MLRITNLYEFTNIDKLTVILTPSESEGEESRELNLEILRRYASQNDIRIT